MPLTIQNLLSGTSITLKKIPIALLNLRGKLAQGRHLLYQLKDKLL
jgi:hypothetical protein